MNVCKHVIYAGRVQGVGFRHTTWQLAQDYPVVGYVRNLADGTVEVVVEGPGDQVQAFLTALARRMRQYIQHTSETDATPSGATEFEVRY